MRHTSARAVGGSRHSADGGTGRRIAYGYGCTAGSVIAHKHRRAANAHLRSNAYDRPGPAHWHTQADQHA